MNPTVVPPILTVLLIAANVLVFFFLQPSPDSQAGREFLYENAAIACELSTGEALSVSEANANQCVDGNGQEIFPDKSVQLAGLVSMFLHGGVLHLLGNMWFLWIFGNNVEEAFGRIGFLVLYLAAGIAGTVGFVALNPESTIPLVGASGAIAGILGAYLVLFPQHRIMSVLFLIFIPTVIAVPAIVFLGLWFGGQFILGDPGVAVEAHVAGFAAGAIVALVLRGPLLARVRRIQRPFRFARQ